MFMERRYKQLSLEERDRITEMKLESLSLRAIAKELGRSPSTLSREIWRNSTPAYRVYLSHRAHARAVKRKREAGERTRLKNDEIVSYVRDKLALEWSPEIIEGKIGQDIAGASISYEAIYQYVYHPDTEGRQELIRHLVRGIASARRRESSERSVRPGFPTEFQ